MRWKVLMMTSEVINLSQNFNFLSHNYSFNRDSDFFLIIMSFYQNFNALSYISSLIFWSYYHDFQLGRFLFFSFTGRNGLPFTSDRDLTLSAHTPSWIFRPVSTHCSVSSGRQPLTNNIMYMYNCDQQPNLAREELSNQTQRAEELTLQRLFYNNITGGGFYLIWKFSLSFLYVLIVL